MNLLVQSVKPRSIDGLTTETVYYVTLAQPRADRHYPARDARRKAGKWQQTGSSARRTLHSGSAANARAAAAAVGTECARARCRLGCATRARPLHLFCRRAARTIFFVSFSAPAPSVWAPRPRPRAGRAGEHVAGSRFSADLTSVGTAWGHRRTLCCPRALTYRWSERPSVD